jgi:hypothetical protein
MEQCHSIHTIERNTYPSAQSVASLHVAKICDYVIQKYLEKRIQVILYNRTGVQPGWEGRRAGLREEYTRLSVSSPRFNQETSAHIADAFRHIISSISSDTYIQPRVKDMLSMYYQMSKSSEIEQCLLQPHKREIFCLIRMIQKFHTAATRICEITSKNT